ncbi:bifunctional diguanylate cyclase/phosphodiesterase [Arcobacter suis]|uniref:PAS sensor-containing diguanylate cyclase/phosphodiesterase n=1 Tax=Arcobacter suis CECT 7833 TaxID=663365 RepID=A0AAD0SRV4_9BACT|nr:GGDEF domain-containing phosphodiesterase [Arcobacter suis]AXX90235.1 PAS sensor-containing diguanylate cyclase/phosphodiesterase [Arcobacter suis CECT 7833]
MNFFLFITIFYISSIIFILYILIKIKKKNKKLKIENHILRQYKNAIDESNIVSISDLKGNITYVNDKFCEVTLYTKEEVINKPHSLLKGEDSKKIFEKLWETIKSKKIWQGVLKNKKKNGDFYYVNSTIMPILDENNEIIEYIAIRHEITELVHKSKELEKNLREDLLTKKGNRYKLLEDISLASKPYLALLDINRFSEINDFYGHAVGDKVLKIIAKTIKEQLPNSNYILYRVYSDEFAVLVDNESKENFLKNIKQISENISSKPIKINYKELYIQTTYNISFEDKENLIETANMIKKYSKTNKNVTIYDKSLELEKIYEKNIFWTLKIKKALEEDRIVPYYQAIYNLETNKIEKYESLMRLIKEDGSVISPYYFLEISKKSKQYLKLTKRIIRKSFEYFKDKDFEFSVNLTIKDIKNHEVSSFIIEKLKEHNLASKVVFEIVESEGIDNFEEINNFIDKVKELGCKIAIDDFGSGYSNFEYLIKLNADYIKIDGSLIKDILVNKNNQEIVITIIDFAKRQGFKTIAEFVSSKEIFDKVKELGVDYAQGYYIGEPKVEILTIA